MKPEQKTLRIGLAGKLSMNAENNAVPALVDQLWKPDDPLAVIAVLRDATQEALDEVSAKENGATLIQKVWDTSTRVLGYLMLCLVSREWADCQQEANNPYYDIPLNKKISLELVSASVNETAACLMSMTLQDLHGEKSGANETFIPEGGWQDHATVANIVEGIYCELYQDQDKVERQRLMTRIREEIQAGKRDIYELDFMNEQFRFAHLRGEKNHYLAVDSNNPKHPARVASVCVDVRAYLPDLPIVRFGASDNGNGQDILSVKEGALALWIVDFLKLIEDYQ